MWRFALVILLVLTMSTPIFISKSKAQLPSGEVYVGVTFGGTTVEEAKQLIDTVKSYANLFVQDSWTISGGSNSSALTEICDYAVASDMYFIVYFNFVYQNYTRTIGTIYNSSSWEDWGLTPWHLQWLNEARERYGDKFLGAYLYDEPGGKQIECGHWNRYNTSLLSGRAYTPYRNVTTIDGAASTYVSSIARSGSMQVLTNTSYTYNISHTVPVVTSDFALYWFDYKAGYNTVFVELGNRMNKNEKIRQIALCRGAAKAQNKDWGAIVVLDTDTPPTAQNGTAVLGDMTMAYEAGAKYILVFNYALNGSMNGPGSLTDEHFAAMKQFWDNIHSWWLPLEHGKYRGEAALVLPENYGWGLRHPNDKMWGLWPPDDRASQVWDSVNGLVDYHGLNLDIVYEDANVSIQGLYSQTYLWSSRLNLDQPPIYQAYVWVPLLGSVGAAACGIFLLSKKKKLFLLRKKKQEIQTADSATQPSSFKGLKDWYAKQKTKRAAQRALVPTMLGISTFLLTLASMALGLSLLPVFPQPLPIVIAFLIALVAYENPRFSLPVGGGLIGLGLVYNMSKVNFISVLGNQPVRIAVIFAIIFVFAILPIIFHKHKAAIAIDLGIIAAVLLFNGQAYFLAIPLIFASIVLLRKLSSLTAIYYGLISTPLLMMQYLGFIIEAANIQPDWWVLPNSSPPIFAPLTGVLTTLQDSMIQFRLYDTSLVVDTITAQVTQIPPFAEHTMAEVLSHYLDSVPGIVLFLVIVAASVPAFVFVMRFALKITNVSERILPPIIAAIGTIFLFICLSALGGPLAFEAKIDSGKIAIGAIAAAMFALPALFIDQTPKERGTVEMIAKKARELLDTLGNFENTLRKVEETLPLDVSSIKRKMLILKGRLNDTLSKALDGAYEPTEITGVLNSLEATGKELNSLSEELDASLKAYQILIEGEYSTWVGRFHDIGLRTDIAEKKDFGQNLPVEERIIRIKETIAAGEKLVNEVVKTAEQVYGLVRTLYNPSLPEESQAVAFAKKGLSENVNPWIASNSLFTALNNWKRQYNTEISQSVDYLQNSIGVVAGLSDESESLRLVIGTDSSKILNAAERAENLRFDVEKNTIAVNGIIKIGEAFQTLLDIIRDALVVLNEELKTKEKSIDSLLPRDDYVWEKNVTLQQQMESITDVFLDPSKHGLNRALINLPNAVSCISECVSTIARYNDQQELLLNYPVAETAIEEAFKQKTSISAHDLPFEPKSAKAYLRLFHSKRLRDYSFDSKRVALVRLEK